ncbi:NAD(P)/FAD-dependent oxidoreductase [Streptomyces sp. SLBN-118]|uniref:NAD(P)/FAD-dependent oxidoreductase n=1 Tax=Streptomyces sp. SLBN-118 TaxID=2768454 RepID=UPI0028C4FE96|nr:NAD(P)/FAD-dependent oxidoreductase [Streptomyces sp. SLBN-118]
MVLEVSDRAAGSWPRHHDSLTLFSPARYSSHPHRDEVVAYLTSYAARPDADIRTGTRVTEVRPGATGYIRSLEGGGRLSARAVVAASGAFGRPHRPALPGLEQFPRRVLHAADYRDPATFAGQRIVVVGAGNSAVQIAAELATMAQVTLASRHQAKFARQHAFGRDLHFWLKTAASTPRRSAAFCALRRASSSSTMAATAPHWPLACQTAGSRSPPWRTASRRGRTARRRRST